MHQSVLLPSRTSLENRYSHPFAYVYEAPRFLQLERKPRDFKIQFDYLLFLYAQIFFVLWLRISIIIKRRHYRNAEFASLIAIIELML